MTIPKEEAKPQIEICSGKDLSEISVPELKITLVKKVNGMLWEATKVLLSLCLEGVMELRVKGSRGLGDGEMAPSI